MGCSSCGSGSSNCNCSSSSSCGCGGDCGQPTKIITKQGLTGPQGPQGNNGADGIGATYFFEINQTIDFLDTFVMDNPNIDPSFEIGTIVLAASANGQNKAYEIGTPVKLTPTSQRGNTGIIIAPKSQIHGFVSSYNASTGDLSVEVLGVSGLGTHSDWDVDLNYQPEIYSMLYPVSLAPSGVGSFHGQITIPGNTFYSVEQSVKAVIIGVATGSADPLELKYDGVVCFSKVFSAPCNFRLEIDLTLGYYVVVSSKLTTDVGTDDGIQFLGINDPAYAFNTYKPQFKTDKIIDFTNFGPSQPVSIYSSVAYRN